MSAIDQARAVLAARSKSFALAGRLLSPRDRDRAALVYAWCRRADDAVDGGAADPAAQVARLEDELDRAYAGVATDDLVVDAFAEVARACRIPRRYPAELIAGMAMDASGTRYRSLDDLLLYCYRVAGTVGLMMCHVLGLRDDRALVRGVHLGMAMQLTNVCRDVLEDWHLGRLYLPADLLARAGAPDLADQLGGPFPDDARRPAAEVVAELLRHADRYYASADRGMVDLPWRAGIAIRTARMVYAAIGARIAARAHDPAAGRAVVPPVAKVRLAARAGALSLRELPGRWIDRGGAHIPRREVPFGPEVVTIR